MDLPEKRCPGHLYGMNTLAKIDRLLAEKGMTQTELEHSAGLAPNRIAKLRTSGELTARQALRVARVLDVPIEWLVDDGAPEDVPRITLTDDEIFILDVFRAKGIPRLEAAKRLMGGKENRDRSGA